MKLLIKNMVSLRCKLIVKSELETLNIPYLSVELGEVLINTTLKDEEKESLRVALLKSGLEIMEDKKSILIEKIKKRYY